MNRNFYLAIFIIGLVFAILSYISNFGFETYITVLYLTISLVFLIRFIAEYKYYKSYRAPLASAIFLLIPSFIAIAGSYVSRNPALNGQPLFADKIMYISMDLSFLPIRPLIFFTNSFSVIFALPFYIVLLILLYRYYLGIYPRLFILRKKFFKQFAMYYNAVLIAIIVFIWLSTKTIEIFELTFVVISIIFIIRTYVFKVVLVPVRVVPSRNKRTAPRRSYSSPQQPTVYTNPSRNTSSESINHQRNSQPSGSVTPRSPISPPRSTSTIQARPISQPRTPVRAQHTTPSSSSIEVVEGIPVSTTQKVKTDNKSGITKKQLKELIPIAVNLTQEDFRCIFC